MADADPSEALRIENAALRLRVAMAEQQLARLRAAAPKGGEGVEAGVLIAVPVHPVRDPVVAQRLTDLETANAALVLRLKGPPPPPAGVSVQILVESLALSAALGEATLADRTIGSLTMSTQLQLVELGQGSVSVQFPSPSTPLPSDALSTLTVALDRTPPGPGDPDPPTLYRILADRQALYSTGGWWDTDQGKAIVAACTKALAEASGWTFASVLSTADAITTSEQALAAALGGRQPPPAGTSDYAAATASSRQVVDALKAKTTAPVAGDLAALSAALHAVSVAASGVTP